jgi:hypothetical protein
VVEGAGAVANAWKTSRQRVLERRIRSSCKLETEEPGDSSCVISSRSRGLARRIYACAVLVAQLSDTHLLADPDAQLWGHNATRNMAAVIEAVPPRVDVMVVTGDVAEGGTHEAYRRALSLTAGRAQHRYFLAGNHDDPKVMRDVFGPAEPSMDGRYRTTLDNGACELSMGWTRSGSRHGRDPSAVA